MIINTIKIRKVYTGDTPMKALVSVVVDDCIAIHELKVVQGNNRLFVAMPSREDENGTYRDIIHPISPEARDQLENAILLAYNSFVEVSEKGGDLVCKINT